ncbi:MAG: glycosyltransferase family 2 protein [Coleofasciculus sp.]|uniref:glycosyltransferase family 2 protein n=1 Tax=Coleofasciculus sp. TaxID=3100458 RepID=UPI003A20B835
METVRTSEPQVTVVVTPRERFSYTRESLESIYDYTEIPFNLVYVDGGSPQHIQQYLANKAQEKDFQLIRVNRYLSPNQSRNLGLRQVKTKYVVFIDNDVVVTPGWLKGLVECANETGAAVVGPVICIGTPIHDMIHNPGGSISIKEEQVGEEQIQRFHHKCHFKRRVNDVRDRLQRAECDYVEFHCMLARTDIFEKTGPLDEGLLSTREHLDFCMLVARAGGKIYAERQVIVTYVPGPPVQWSDLGFFMLRWSDAWDLASLEHFREKWDLTEDHYFQSRYKKLGFRRHKAYVKPLAKSLLFGQRSLTLEKILIRLDRMVNRYVSDRYARSQRQSAPTQDLEMQPFPASTNPSK